MVAGWFTNRPMHVGHMQQARRMQQIISVDRKSLISPKLWLQGQT